MIIAAMVACALLPMFLVTYLMIRGKSGLVLTKLSLLGAVIVILYYAVTTPIGIDPLQAYAINYLFALPAMIGACSGALLGWLIRRRRDRRP